MFERIGWVERMGVGVGRMGNCGLGGGEGSVGV